MSDAEASSDAYAPPEKKKRRISNTQGEKSSKKSSKQKTDTTVISSCQSNANKKCDDKQKNKENSNSNKLYDVSSKGELLSDYKSVELLCRGYIRRNVKAESRYPIEHVSLILFNYVRTIFYAFKYDPKRCIIDYSNYSTDNNNGIKLNFQSKPIKKFSRNFMRQNYSGGIFGDRYMGNENDANSDFEYEHHQPSAVIFMPFLSDLFAFDEYKRHVKDKYTVNVNKNDSFNWDPRQQAQSSSSSSNDNSNSNSNSSKFDSVRLADNNNNNNNNKKIKSGQVKSAHSMNVKLVRHVCVNRAFFSYSNSNGFGNSDNNSKAYGGYDFQIGLICIEKSFPHLCKSRTKTIYQSLKVNKSKVKSNKIRNKTSRKDKSRNNNSNDNNNNDNDNDDDIHTITRMTNLLKLITQMNRTCRIRPRDKFLWDLSDIASVKKKIKAQSIFILDFSYGCDVIDNHLDVDTGNCAFDCPMLHSSQWAGRNEKHHEMAPCHVPSVNCNPNAIKTDGEEEEEDEFDYNWILTAGKDVLKVYVECVAGEPDNDNGDSDSNNNNNNNNDKYYLSFRRNDDTIIVGKGERSEWEEKDVVIFDDNGKILLDFSKYEYVFAMSSQSCDCQDDSRDVGFEFDVSLE